MASKQETPKQKKPPNPFIRFTSVAFQMGLTIYFGNALGKWLDIKYQQSFWESTVTLFAVFMAIYQVISQVIKIAKNND